MSQDPRTTVSIFDVTDGEPDNAFMTIYSNSIPRVGEWLELDVTPNKGHEFSPDALAELRKQEGHYVVVAVEHVTSFRDWNIRLDRISVYVKRRPQRVWFKAKGRTFVGNM